MFPKPLKRDRLEARDERKIYLKEYREQQYCKAFERDGGKCALCGKPANDVHHCYGRGVDAGDWREHYTNLMCVCRGCHPGRIVGERAGKNLEFVEDKLKEINNGKKTT